MKKSDEFLLLDKKDLRKLSVKDISIPFPDLKNIFESKANVIANWLVDWIDKDFKAGKIEQTDLLPQKADLAYHLGVSIGTMQNAFRLVEDKGYVESKQCIGTMVRDRRKNTHSVRKLTSKRDICVEQIKKYILEKHLKLGDKLPSSRVLSAIIGISPNTIRLSLEKLCSMRILARSSQNSNDTVWVINSREFSASKNKAELKNNVTLVEKVEKDLEKYITKNLKVGDKLPAHEDLSEILKVSIKTTHDALKSLIKRGILLARRGRYGTTVIKMPNDNIIQVKKETSIFAPAQETAFYNYEKTQNHIKSLIAENYDIGAKLPSIITLSKTLDLSPNTVRKALNNLAEEGYLRFIRGRYGGTFVIDIPDVSTHSFKWLAVNPKYVEVYK